MRLKTKNSYSLIFNPCLSLSSPKYSTEEDADAGEGRGEEEWEPRGADFLFLRKKDETALDLVILAQSEAKGGPRKARCGGANYCSGVKNVD